MGSARANQVVSRHWNNVNVPALFPFFDDGRVEIRRNEFLLSTRLAIRFFRMQMLSDCVFFLLPVVSI